MIMNEVTIDVRRNSTSASSALADELCPGRFQAQRGIPEPEESDDAKTGRRIHAAIAKGSPDGLSLEEVETFDACCEIEHQKAIEFFGDDFAKAKVFREQRYWVKYQNGNGEIEHSGQPDTVYRFGSKALICDFKVLRGNHPESSRNLQLRDYAVLVTGHFVNIQEVGTVVIQPLITHKPSICVYDKLDIEKAVANMFGRIVGSNDPKSPRVPGKSQCEFCKAKSVCVEYQGWAGTMLPANQELFKVAMANWTPEQRALAAEIISPAGKRLEEIKAFLKDGIKRDPNFIPGWTLSKGRVIESITNPQVCFTRYVALGGDMDSFMRTLTVGKTKLKEALNALTGAKGKALDGALKTLTDGISASYTSEGSLTKIKE
jgi:hypothetical protein